jgi:hypothetical protein
MLTTMQKENLGTEKNSTGREKKSISTLKDNLEAALIVTTGQMFLIQ